MNANLTSSTVSDKNSVSKHGCAAPKRIVEILEGLDDSLRDLYQALGKHLIVLGVDTQ